MNYKQRISALQNFRSQVASGTIEDNASSFSASVSGWKGGVSKAGYSSYITEVKSDTKTIKGKRASFLGKVDERITSVQAKFDEEYRLHSWYFRMKHDTDPIKDKQHKRNQLSILNIDSSVKSKIRSNFGL